MILKRAAASHHVDVVRSCALWPTADEEGVPRGTLSPKVGHQK